MLPSGAGRVAAGRAGGSRGGAVRNTERDNVAGEETGKAGGGRPDPMAVVAGISVVLTVAILLAVYGLSRKPPGAPIEILPPPSTPTRGPTPTPVPWFVYVTGAVERPGVVQVQPGARVQDAIRAAGGSAADADLYRVNLAAPLYDGQHLRVPVEGEELSPDTPPGGGTIPRLININSATIEELTALPGVGEATATAIVAYRQQHGLFRRVEEIMNVPGIGPSKFEEFREMITVGP